jgi:hypothetical protein
MIREARTHEQHVMLVRPSCETSTIDVANDESNSGRNESIYHDLWLDVLQRTAITCDLILIPQHTPPAGIDLSLSATAIDPARRLQHLLLDYATKTYSSQELRTCDSESIFTFDLDYATDYYLYATNCYLQYVDAAHPGIYKRLSDHIPVAVVSEPFRVSYTATRPTKSIHSMNLTLDVRAYQAMFEDAVDNMDASSSASHMLSLVHNDASILPMSSMDTQGYADMHLDPSLKHLHDMMERELKGIDHLLCVLACSAVVLLATLVWMLAGINKKSSHERDRKDGLAYKALPQVPASISASNFPITEICTRDNIKISPISFDQADGVSIMARGSDSSPRNGVNMEMKTDMHSDDKAADWGYVHAKAARDFHLNPMEELRRRYPKTGQSNHDAAASNAAMECLQRRLEQKQAKSGRVSDYPFVEEYWCK